MVNKKSLDRFIIIGIIIVAVLFFINLFIFFRKNMYLNNEIDIGSYMTDYDYSMLEKYVNKNYTLGNEKSEYSRSSDYEKILIDFSREVTEAFYDKKVTNDRFKNKYIVRKNFNVFSVSDYQDPGLNFKYNSTTNNILSLKFALNSQNISLEQIQDVKVYYYFKNYYLILKVKESNQIAYIEYKVVNELSSGMLKIQNIVYYTESELNDYNDNNFIKRFNVSFFDKNPKISNFFANKIYNNSIKSIVKIEVYKEDSLIDTVTGFFIDTNVIVTTFDIFDSGIFQRYKYKIFSNDDKLYTYEGLLSFSRDDNIALIKTVQKTGTPLQIQSLPYFGDFDDVVALSYDGIYIGSYIETLVGKSYSFKIALPLGRESRGGPLIGSSGNVIGVNTKIMQNSSILISTSTLSLSNPFSNLEKLKDKDKLSSYLVKPNRMEIR